MLYLSQIFYLQLQLVWHNTTEMTVSQINFSFVYHITIISPTTRIVFEKKKFLPAVSLSENLATLHVDP